MGRVEKPTTRGRTVGEAVGADVGAHDGDVVGVVGALVTLDGSVVPFR